MKTGKSGPGIVILLVLVPVFFWLAGARWGTPTQIWYSIGRGSALAGYTLLCLNFVLSARLKILEPFFAGLPRVYIFHHLTGVAAAVLILIHPISIFAGYLSVSTTAAFNLILPHPENVPLDLAKAGWLVIMGVLAVTIFAKMEYDAWKKIHKLIGLGFILAGFHVFFMGSTVAAQPMLKFYLLILTAAALASYGYRTVFGRWLVRKRGSTVLDVRQLNENVREIILKTDKNKIFDFYPGQFVFIEAEARGELGQSHPFSPTSLPGENKLVLAAKNIGGYTSRLIHLKKGARIKVEGPFGRFSYRFFPYPRQVWIAGGIGITPFVSMARSMGADRLLVKELPPTPSLTKEGEDTMMVEVDLYYTVREYKEAVYQDVFKDLDKKNPGFHFHLHTSNNMGRLTADKIKSELKDYKKREYFVCGPGQMMKDMRKQLRDSGVLHSHIHSEEFSLN